MPRNIQERTTGNTYFVDDNRKPSVNQERRKALKTIASGTAVAGALAISSKWSKPVVDTIILPAHAQATNVERPAVVPTTISPLEEGGGISWSGAVFTAQPVPAPTFEVAPSARPATLQKKRRKK